MTPQPLAALEQLVHALERLGVAYAVGGSVAAGAWGEPRATNDVDLLAALGEEHVKPLAAALSGGFYVDEDLVRQAVASHTAFNVIHLASYLKIDVFVEGEDVLDVEQLERSVERPLAPGSSREYRVTSPEVIVVRKLDWYRLGGESSERQWRDVLAILRLRSDSLDQGLLASLASAKGLGDLLERAQRS